MRIRVATVSTATLALTGVGAALPATAGASCGSAPVNNGGVYTVTFTSTAPCTWTVPAGVDQLEALLVGAGGAGVYGYGGGGGDVRIVALQPSETLTVAVGSSSAATGTSDRDTSVRQGSAAALVATGGQDGIDASVGGTSGSGEPGSLTGSVGAGGGAGGAAINLNGGIGETLSAVPSESLTVGLSSLFASDARCFGGGGATSEYVNVGVGQYTTDTGTATCGGGYVIDTNTSTPFASGRPEIVQATANSGGGGAASGGMSGVPMLSGVGADGYVEIRYTLPCDLTAATLVSTGLYEYIDTTRCAFVAPAGTAALDAAVVGSGGTGYGGAAGGGGEVLAVTGTLDPTLAVSVRIGVSGSAETSTVITQNGSTWTALGGANGVANVSGGASGSGNAGDAAGGGGGATAAASGTNGGDGETVTAGLFESSTVCYGGGGASAISTVNIGLGGGFGPPMPLLTYSLISGVPGCAGGKWGPVAVNTPTPIVPVYDTPTANRGGGAGSVKPGPLSLGGDGVVVFRYTVSALDPNSISTCSFSPSAITLNPGAESTTVTTTVSGATPVPFGPNAGKFSLWETATATLAGSVLPLLGQVQYESATSTFEYVYGFIPVPPGTVLKADFYQLGLNQLPVGEPACSLTVTIGGGSSKLQTVTDLSSDTTTTTYGDDETFTATVTPDVGAAPTANPPVQSAPSGQITFYDSATVLDTCTVDAGGSCSIVRNDLHVGVHTLHAEYSGDDTYTASTSANLAHTVSKATLRISPHDETVTAGSATPGSSFYGLSVAGWKLGETATSALNYAAPTCGSNYAVSDAPGTTTISCGGNPSGAAGSADDYDFVYGDTATLTIRASEVVLNYVGPSVVYTDSPTTTVSLTANYAPAAYGCLVTFSLTDSNSTSWGPYTASTYANGNASTALITLPQGVYEVTVTVGGDCSGAPDASGTLSILPGTLGKGTIGGGWYKSSIVSPPKVGFGYNVQQTSQVTDAKTKAVTTTWKGQMVWVSKSGWRIKSAWSNQLIKYTSGTTSGIAGWVIGTCPTGIFPSGATPKCGTFRGTGVLEYWDSTLNNGFGGWKKSTWNTVNFAVTVYDGGSVSTCKTIGKTKTCTTSDLTDYFGIQITKLDGTAISGPPASQPIILSGGSLKAA